MTAKELAERAGISRSYLGKRLRDEASLTSNDIEAICDAFGVDILTFANEAVRRMRR